MSDASVQTQTEIQKGPVFDLLLSGGNADPQVHYPSHNFQDRPQNLPGSWSFHTLQIGYIWSQRHKKKRPDFIGSHAFDFSDLEHLI
jgi:hypothetical protein